MDSKAGNGLNWCQGLAFGALSLAVSFSIPSLRYVTEGSFLEFLRLSGQPNAFNPNFPDYPRAAAFFVFQVPQTLSAVSSALLWQVRRQSTHLWESTVYACLLWAQIFLSTVRVVLGAELSWYATFFDMFLYPVNLLLNKLVHYSFLRLLYKRASSIEKSMKKSRWTKCIFRLIVVSVLAWLVESVSFNYVITVRVLGDPYSKALHSVIWVAFCVERGARWLSTAWCIFILAAPLRQFRRAGAIVGPQVQYHMDWALQQGRLQFFGASLCFTAQLVDELGFCMMNSLPKCKGTQSGRYECAIFNVLTYGFSCSLQAIGALLLSGAGTYGEYDEKGEVKAVRTEPCSGTHDAEYQQKVAELASRGITVQQLLEFYRYLGSPESCMRHYRPDTHSTHDVVRQAIIPVTKESGQAYATVAGATPPKKFVTHNWANLFRDLLAAVVSDALGEGEFFAVSCLLDHNLPYLEEMLRKDGALQKAYWICAFSVAQHRSICHQVLPNCVDSLLGTPYPVCDCHWPKELNDSPPVTSDGRSIPCEMNKFQDMIRHLARDDFGGQVVAIDCSFGLFQRCWCVAEVAEAHCLHLCQEVKVQSRRLLLEKQPLLKSLKIEEMEGARPEDVKEILDRIQDKEAFNRHLHDIFFDEETGLITRWRVPDSASALKDIGRVSRMLSACRAPSGVLHTPPTHFPWGAPSREERSL